MAADALPADADVGRIALRVADLDAAAEFYETVIGLERLDPDGGTGRIVLGVGAEALLVLHEAPDAEPRGRDQAGLYHAAIRVPDRTALGAAIERIHGRHRLDGASDHGVSEAIYLRDPEGNGLEVYCDRPRSAWTVEGDLVHFDSNPLDLDALVDQSDAADRVPVGTEVGHVHLEVADLDTAREFYVDALGANVRATLPDAVFVAAGDYHHHVGLNAWRNRTEPAGDGLGLAWVELVVPDASERDAAASRLAAAGYEAEEAEDGTVTVADPDGIRLRLRAGE